MSVTKVTWKTYAVYLKHIKGSIELNLFYTNDMPVYYLFHPFKVYSFAFYFNLTHNLTCLIDIICGP